MMMQAIFPTESGSALTANHNVADATLEMWRRQVHDMLSSGMSVTIRIEAVSP